MRILAVLFWVMAGAAWAQTPMTGDEFETYTRGKTLTFMESGQAYGIEQYLPGRQVRWAFDNDECQDGHWFEADPALICFVYDGSDAGPQCWNFFRTDKGLRARFMGTTDGRELYEARASRAPLLCLGPEVGV